MDEKIADGIIVGGHMERYTTYFGVHLKFFKTKFFLNFFFYFFKNSCLLLNVAPG